MTKKKKKKNSARTLPHYPKSDCFHEDKLLGDDLLWVQPGLVVNNKLQIKNCMLCTVLDVA